MKKQTNRELKANELFNSIPPEFTRRFNFELRNYTPEKSYGKKQSTTTFSISCASNSNYESFSMPLDKHTKIFTERNILKIERDNNGIRMYANFYLNGIFHLHIF